MIFYNIFISPIELIIDWVFNFFARELPFLGILGAIVGVSLAINFLALPIYNISDALQDKEREIQEKLKPGIQRIKAVFFGDERFMILQTFYRENHYHPLYAFKNSLSILIEIPFFIAAYHYLSNCELLKASPPPSFLKNILNSFSEPDNFYSFKIFNHTFFINLLPILMTLINVLSTAVYSRKSSAREKIQIYGLACVFLILLYDSPSGLVIYWILNNLFSFAKNIVKSCRNPSRILNIVISVLSVSLCLLFWILKPDANLLKKILLTAAALFICALPTIFHFMKKIEARFSNKTAEKDFFPLFLFSSIGLAVLLGLALPLNVISSDAAEFSFIGATESPFSYVKTSAFLFLGLCVAWPLLIYKMLDEKSKILMTKVMFTVFIAAILNAFVFKFNYGTLNVLFTVEGEILRKSYPLLNFLSLASFFAVFVVLTFNFEKLKKASLYICVILTISLSALSAKSALKTKSTFELYKKNIASQKEDNLNCDIEPIFHLSKTKENVVVFFLDRAASVFFPVFQKDMPELAEKFAGFTYFPNTISFGNCTLYGSPAMLGGYDYTPENINSRKNVPLQEKFDESALVMPLNFLKNGFSVSVSGLPSTELKEKNDFHEFKNYPEIKTYGIFKKFLRRYSKEKCENIKFDEICRKGISNFSILQVLLPGTRNSFCRISKNIDYEYSESFINNFSALYFLRNLTDFSSDEKNFVFIGNETPHFATYLNTKTYDEISIDEKKSNIPETLNIDDEKLIMNYQVFAATLKQIALWLDYLKENGCLNNTRVVITSDHGFRNNIKSGSAEETEFYNQTMLFFNPLLMVKDFNSNSEIKTDSSVMTNADTIFLAADGIIENLENPFLNHKLQQEKHRNFKLYLAKTKKNFNKYLLLDKPNFLVKNGFNDFSGWKKIEY